MQLGIDTFVGMQRPGPPGDAARVRDLLDEIELAGRVGLDVVGIGKHYPPDYISSSPAKLLAAAAARSSFNELYPCFGFDLENYDQLVTEKLELLHAIRGQTSVTWSGSHCAALSGQGVYPRPVQNPLPVFVGVGGTP